MKKRIYNDTNEGALIAIASRRKQGLLRYPEPTNRKERRALEAILRKAS